MGLLDTLKIRDETIPESVEEIVPDTPAELFAQDPEPGTPARTGAKRAGRVAARPAVSSAKLARQVGEDLAALIAGGAAVWGLTDDCCAPVLEEQAEPIAKALTAILARNPRLLARFADADVAVYTVQAIALVRACSPVVKAVYANHVSKAVDDDQEGSGGDRLNLADFPAYAAGAPAATRRPVTP